MGTEVITYSRIGNEDIRFGTGTYEVVLADGRKVLMSEVDLRAIANDPDLSTQIFRYTDSDGQVLHAFGSAS
jgi:hypothetical protein